SRAAPGPGATGYCQQRPCRVAGFPTARSTCSFVIPPTILSASFTSWLDGGLASLGLLEPVKSTSAAAAAPAARAMLPPIASRRRLRGPGLTGANISSTNRPCHARPRRPAAPARAGGRRDPQGDRRRRGEARRAPPAGDGH